MENNANNLRFCPSCGTKLDNEGSVKFCPNCGNALESTGVPNRTQRIESDDLVYPESLRVSPTVAAILSFFIFGLGQMLNGQLAKGILIFVLSTLIIGVTIGFAIIPIWIVVTIDAYKCAKKLENGQSIGKFSFF